MTCTVPKSGVAFEFEIHFCILKHHQQILTSQRLNYLRDLLMRSLQIADLLLQHLSIVSSNLSREGYVEDGGYSNLFV
jgi:hypothetical protein